MSPRIEEELAMLAQQFKGVVVKAGGEWVLVPRRSTERSEWSCPEVPVVFQNKEAYPGTPPYGFYVPAGLRFHDGLPDNYQEPAPQQPPFDGDWGFFSWQPEDGRWFPSADAASGSNLCIWVRGFADRFKEGK